MCCIQISQFTDSIDVSTCMARAHMTLLVCQYTPQYYINHHAQRTLTLLLYNKNANIYMMYHEI